MAFPQPPDQDTSVLPHGSNCVECENLNYSSSTSDTRSWEEDQQDLFHSNCKQCTSRSQDNLCSLCQHLRIRHLIFCAENVASECGVDFGSKCEVQRRRDSGCAFCGLVECAIDVYSSFQRPEDPDLSSLTFSINFNKADYDPPDPAQIWLEVFDEDEEMIFTFPAFQAYFKGCQSLESDSWPILDSGLGTVTSQIQWDRVRNWVKYCDKNHERCAPPGRTAFPPEFRLIDVSERRLVQPREWTPFLALSYVWGKSPDPSKVLAKISNIRELETEGALRAAILPDTIEQAMEICKSLGERYLWADRLCIVQDDAINKQQQIESMVDIYSQATVVLVVAAGDSVDEPIPGVATPRVYSTKSTSFDGLEILTVLPKFGQSVLPSIWASRGWTYQEAVLPEKKLYFTSHQVIYECHKGHIYEDNSLNQDPWIDLDIPVGGGYQQRMSHLRSRGASPMTPFDTYRLHIQGYNCRSLTYLTDIYNGIAGVLVALYGSLSACYYGLPLIDLSRALLWHPEELLSEDTVHNGRTSDDILLPTWSWSSVSGSIDHLFKYNFCGPVISWAYVVRAEKGYKLTNAKDDDSVQTEWNKVYEIEKEALMEDWVRRAPQISMAIAAAEGCLQLKSPVHARFWEKESFLEAGRGFLNRWPDFNAFKRDLSIYPPQKLAVNLEAGMLATQAQSVSLNVAPHKPHHGGSTWSCRLAGSCYEIHDGSNQRIGMLMPIPTSCSTGDIRNDSVMDFIGLSISTFPGSGFSDGPACLLPKLGDEVIGIPTSKHYKNAQDLRHFDLTYSDADGELIWPAPIMNVMAVERHGAVCRRRSVGWVLLKRWAKLSRKSEDIVLI